MKRWAWLVVWCLLLVVDDSYLSRQLKLELGDASRCWLSSRASCVANFAENTTTALILT
jgi:hypothetical protein